MMAQFEAEHPYRAPKPIFQKMPLDKIRRRFLWLELIWADGGYSAWQVETRSGRGAGLRRRAVPPG